MCDPLAVVRHLHLQKSNEYNRPVGSKGLLILKSGLFKKSISGEKQLLMHGLFREDQRKNYSGSLCTLHCTLRAYRMSLMSLS